MLTTFFVSLGASIAAFFLKIFFARRFAPASAADAALQEQRAIDQAIIDRPNKSQAVKDLESGNV